MHCAAEMPRAKQSSLKCTIFPVNEDCASSQISHRGSETASTAVSSRQKIFLSERTEDVRKAYARWDRGNYSNEAFKTELQSFGLAVTKELERLLEVHNCSRNLSFGKLMAALQVDENDGRRARNNYAMSETDVSSGFSAAQRQPEEFQERRPGFDEQSVCSSSVTAATGDLQNSLRQAICDFVDGRIPAISFRRHLHQSGVPVTFDVDRLIRTHECDNSVRFQDFARAVLRQDRQDHLNSVGSATSSPHGRRAPEHFATGGQRGAGSAWSENPERLSQAPSDVGSSASSRQRPYQSNAPWATGDSHPQPRVGRPGSTPGPVPVYRPPSAPASSRYSSDRDGGQGYRRAAAQRDSRDFLRWDGKEPSTGSALGQHSQNGRPSSRSGEVSRALTPPPQSRHPTQRGSDEMADCLSWPHGRQQSKPAQLQTRFGKHYGERAPAHEILPWADTPQSDGSFGVGVDRQLPSRSVYTAPYGTEDDVYGRSEDPGTHEYRPQLPVDPRMRPF